MNIPKGKPVIRPATLGDVVSISKLCSQLGYPSSLDAVKQRLETLLLDKDYAVYVAEIDGEVAGWGCRCRLLTFSWQEGLLKLPVWSWTRNAGEQGLEGF